MEILFTQKIDKTYSEKFMLEKKRFGIVGTGVIASFHIKALQQIEEVEITSICDINEEQAKKYGEEFNLPWTTNYDEMLKDPNIDIIDITVPSGLHADLGIKAAEAGKNVIVEKPIDITLQKADALINACKNNSVTLGVISQMRFFDSLLKVYKIVESGKLGEIIQGDAYVKWYRSEEYYKSGGWRGTKKLDGGGAYMNQGVHFVDIILSIMGSVKTVTAKVKTAVRDIEVEDLGMAMIEYQSGAFGVIQASTAIYPGSPGRFELLGTKGTLIFEGDEIKTLEIEGEESIDADSVIQGSASNPLNVDILPYVREFTDILEAIKEKREPKVNGAEARKALEVILAIYKSSELNETVELPIKV